MKKITFLVGFIVFLSASLFAQNKAYRFVQVFEKKVAMDTNRYCVDTAWFYFDDNYHVSKSSMLFHSPGRENVTPSPDKYVIINKQTNRSICLFKEVQEDFFFDSVATTIQKPKNHLKGYRFKKTKQTKEIAGIIAHKWIVSHKGLKMKTIAYVAEGIPVPYTNTDIKFFHSGVWGYLVLEYERSDGYSMKTIFLDEVDNASNPAEYPKSYRDIIGIYLK